MYRNVIVLWFSKNGSKNVEYITKYIHVVYWGISKSCLFVYLL